MNVMLRCHVGMLFIMMFIIILYIYLGRNPQAIIGKVARRPRISPESVQVEAGVEAEPRWQ